MATSGSANLTYTGAEIVAEAYKALGLRVTTTADTYGTTSETIANAALRLVGIYGPTDAAVYTTAAADVVARALRMVGVSSPTATQTTQATTALTWLVNTLYGSGFTTSGGNYEDHWADPITFRLAETLAYEYGKADILPHLQALAAGALGRAMQRPYTATATSTTLQESLTRLGTLWGQYGTITSGGSWSNRWAEALTAHLALIAAAENNRPIPQGLAELAQRYFEEARSFTQPSTGLTELNMLVKSWNAYGLRGWLRKTVTKTLVSGTASYTIYEGGSISTTKPLEILVSYLRDAQGVDYSVTVVDFEVYHAISDKDDAGQPQILFYDPTLASPTVYPWPVINESGWTLYLVYRRPIEDFDLVTNDADFPGEWFEPLHTNLAVKLGPIVDKPVDALLYKRAQNSLALAIGTARELPKNRPVFGWPSDGH